jgi:ABC-type phosphate transport system substrate-binding protein
LTAALLAAFVAVSSPAEAGVAVIVNSENTITSLSQSQLKKMYRGKIRRWDFASDSKQPVQLADYKNDDAWVLGFYKKATGLSAMHLRTGWFGMVFRGEIPDLPARLNSEEKMIAHVASHPNSIGFVQTTAAGKLPKGVKVLKIDSKGPADKGYPFPYTARSSCPPD